jgi:Domain of Unknown Function (DUF1080)
MKPYANFFLLFALMLTTHFARAQPQWRPLFDGKTLKGWKANLHPESFCVADGAIRTQGVSGYSHLFYVGDQPDPFVRFKNFELEATVRGEPNSNSGIFFHTDLALRGSIDLLANGYELQLNSSPAEARKTGSLYAIVDLGKSPVDEAQWFKVHLMVQGKRIVIRLDGQVVIDYTEPEQPMRPPERAGRRLNPEGGAIALQAHDPGSVFYFKEIRVRVLP